MLHTTKKKTPTLSVRYRQQPVALSFYLHTILSEQTTKCTDISVDLQTKVPRGGILRGVNFKINEKVSTTDDKSAFIANAITHRLICARFNAQ